MILESVDDTAQLASKIAKQLKLGALVGFIGDLGVGKTTLVNLLLKTLGTKEGGASPTFVLCHEYSGTIGLIEHWDLYRLKAAPDDLKYDSGCDKLRLVEWVNRDTELLQKCDLVVTLSYMTGEENCQGRQVSLGGPLADKVI